MFVPHPHHTHTRTHTHTRFLSNTHTQEVEPATLATAWRAYKDPELNPYQAHDKLRGATVDAIKVCVCVCLLGGVGNVGQHAVLDVHHDAVVALGLFHDVLDVHNDDYDVVVVALGLFIA